MGNKHLPVLLVLPLLTACAGDDVPDTDDAAADQSADDRTDDRTDDEDDEGGDDAAGGGIEPVTVAVTLDGQRVPIASACNGVDGAVLATTEGEVTISLVREEGTALRYQAEGFSAETADVELEEIGVSDVYRATLSSDEVPAVDVELELGDTSVLPDC